MSLSVFAEVTLFPSVTGSILTGLVPPSPARLWQYVPTLSYFNIISLFQISVLSFFVGGGDQPYCFFFSSLSSPTLSLLVYFINTHLWHFLYVFEHHPSPRSINFLLLLSCLLVWCRKKGLFVFLFLSCKFVDVLPSVSRWREKELSKNLDSFLLTSQLPPLVQILWYFLGTCPTLFWSFRGQQLLGEGRCWPQISHKSIRSPFLP